MVIIIAFLRSFCSRATLPLRLYSPKVDTVLWLTLLLGKDSKFLCFADFILIHLYCIFFFLSSKVVVIHAELMVYCWLLSSKPLFC